ncbi:MAG TPA: hypothetical protein VGB74_06825 [Actinoplanes sp.]|jgi:hypothetical protein
METTEHETPAAGSGLEPLGDPDDDTGDFADEHQQFVADAKDDGESESPQRYAGGFDGDGPP